MARELEINVNDGQISKSCIPKTLFAPIVKKQIEADT